MIIVSNNILQAMFDRRIAAHERSNLQFIGLTRRLLMLPDGTEIAIMDYRTGCAPNCICEVARGMVARGSFEEVEL